MSLHKEGKDFFKSLIIKEEPIVKKEPLEELFPCNFCSLSFADEHELKLHELSHDKVHECHFCHITFHTTLILERHLKFHMDSISKMNSCAKAIAEQEAKKSIVLPPYKVKDVSRYKFQCEYCEAKFEHNHNKVQHLKFHTKDRKFLCKHCMASFETEISLKRHEVLYHSIPSNALVCKKCFSTFKDSEQLKIHGEKAHSNKKNYHCQQCSAKFKLEVYLIRHQAIHTQKHLISCKQCFSSFRSNALLRRHMEVHNKEKDRLRRLAMISSKKGSLIVENSTQEN